MSASVRNDADHRAAGYPSAIPARSPSRRPSADPSPDRPAVLHDQALRLGRVVGDRGEPADAESARLSLRHAEVDLVAVVRAAVADREAELRTAGLTVRTRTGSAPLVVYADADRLHQALGNLPSNAARYYVRATPSPSAPPAAPGRRSSRRPTRGRGSPPGNSRTSPTGSGGARAPRRPAAAAESS
ncbi:hypothetical protein [Streptomyces sp. NPDC020996]|uniref:hypothetical protein n=1 Tax=Streptomyces sp. NPDC020996 TaxID=3154791 RepID=UPI003406AE19